jgi:hypothetical protein
MDSNSEDLRVHVTKGKRETYFVKGKVCAPTCFVKAQIKRAYDRLNPRTDNTELSDITPEREKD